MRNRLTRFCLGILVSLTAQCSHAADLTWVTDLPKAQAQANAEKKAVLLFFHGSDWCPLCREMQAQVFAKPEFMAYARQALVLVDVDFPEKVKQDETLKRANLALKTKFNLVDNYPALVLLNEPGETVIQYKAEG